MQCNRTMSLLRFWLAESTVLVLSCAILGVRVHCFPTGCVVMR